MRIFLALLCSLVLATVASAREYKLYAAMLEDTPVDLADGAKWVMDKGDTFPVLMFKEMQTKVILQLAGTQFMVETARVRILEDKKEIAAGLETYRRNVEAYLKQRSDKWEKEAKPKK